MIVEEIVNEEIVLHYSDQGFKIRQIETGFLFDEAGDSLPCAYTYEETGIPVNGETEQAEELDWETAMKIITGEISGDEV